MKVNFILVSEGNAPLRGLYTYLGSLSIRTEFTMASAFQCTLYMCDRNGDKSLEHDITKFNETSTMFKTLLGLLLFKAFDKNSTDHINAIDLYLGL
jgi:hypothetical protein